MAGAGYREWVAGELITDAHMQNYLQDQVIMKFASIAARDNAPTTQGLVLAEGMYCTVNDTDLLYRYNGTAWVEAGGGAGLTVSDTAPSTPVDGAQWFNSTNGKTYVYYTDADSSQWVELDSSGAPISSAVPSGNAIINGAFDINQRQFTSNTVAGDFNFDRWAQTNAGGSFTLTPQTFTPGSAPIAGYEGKNFLRAITASQSAASDYAWHFQKIEDVRTLAGQTATVSFFAKATSGTPKISVELAQNFGSGGSPSAAVNTYAGQVTISTSWARYSVTVAIPSISGKTIGTSGNDHLRLNLMLSAGSDYNARSGSLGIQNNTFDIWGVQLEAGSVATPFKRNAPSLALEEETCQRYFELISSEAAYGLLGVGKAYSTGILHIAIPFKVKKRVTPTSITLSAMSSFQFETGSTNNNTPTSISINGNLCTSQTGVVDVSKVGMFTTGAFYFLQGYNNTNAYIGFSAEL